MNAPRMDWRRRAISAHLKSNVLSYPVVVSGVLVSRVVNSLTLPRYSWFVDANP
jgi:hypothetical protein